jgi:hypothetical protein
MTAILIAIVEVIDPIYLLDYVMRDIAVFLTSRLLDPLVGP